jgi:hypothetical protein
VCVCVRERMHFTPIMLLEGGCSSFLLKGLKNAFIIRKRRFDHACCSWAALRDDKHTKICNLLRSILVASLCDDAAPDDGACVLKCGTHRLAQGRISRVNPFAK